MSEWATDTRFAGVPSVDMEHLDGIAWWKAPVPRLLHRHRAQTRGWLNYFTLIERCACGAARKDRKGRWTGRERRRAGIADTETPRADG